MGEDKELALHSRSETCRKQLALSPMDRVPENPSISVKISSQEVSYRSMRFLYRGRRIRGKQTPRHKLERVRDRESIVGSL
ncbi:hypothetical protein K1719_002239 [Acacia pycnantha]|nr:hypothetical protein K1719_002239 [Acacia pycnantha]